jgi:hypothetical protein
LHLFLEEFPRVGGLEVLLHLIERMNFLGQGRLNEGE